MKKTVTFNFSPFHLLIAMGITAGFGMQAAYAMPVTVTSSIPLSTEIAPRLDKIKAANVAAYKAINQTLDNAFFAPDHMFLNTVVQSADQLSSLKSTQDNGLILTQGSIDRQLQSFAYKLNDAYTHFSVLRQSMQDPNENQVNKLTYMTPSYDTLHLPRDSSQGLLYAELHRATLPVSTPEVLKANAKIMNFDAFFNPVSYSSNETDGTSPSYIDYALQTYDPLAPADLNAGGSGSGAASKDTSIFGIINQKLAALKGGNGQKAYEMLDSILKNPEFQKFWLALRSYEAKRSLLLSNLNFLRAERTLKPGLGAAYNLKDANGNTIKDASPLQVETLMINNTVNNPTWYKNMKTAPPVTIAREQLLLTSLLVKLQFKNQLLNERNLATLSMLVHENLQGSKQLLSMQQSMLSRKLFPESAPQQQQPQVTPQQLNKYRSQISGG